MLARYKKKIRTSLLLTLLIVLISACLTDKRVNEDNALHKIKSIRAAQKIYIDKYKKYGTLEELFQDNLIESELLDGVDKGYKFELKAYGSKYTVNASPLNDSSNNKLGEICIFLDETGIIRAAYDANCLANNSSEPIKNQ